MSEPPAHRDIPIQRDSTFSRATADNAIVFPLGRDFELAFVATSPVPKTNRERKGKEQNDIEMAGIIIEPMIFEVARVRMPPESALTMAIQIVAAAIENDIATWKDFEANFNAFKSASVDDLKPQAD